LSWRPRFAEAHGALRRWRWARSSYDGIAGHHIHLVATFQTNRAVRTGVEGAWTWRERPPETRPRCQVPAPGRRFEPNTIAMVWLVGSVVPGRYLVLSLRTSGGLFLIERMRRKRSSRRRGAVRKMPGAARRMGLRSPIQYCECHRLDAPAVLGWFPSRVLLPVRALTGLTEEQIRGGHRSRAAHSPASIAS